VHTTERKKEDEGAGGQENGTDGKRGFNVSAQQQHRLDRNILHTGSLGLAQPCSVGASLS